MASSPAPQPVDTSNLECGVCYELLLDPVVGSCGHDFCRTCLEKWRSQQRQQGREVKCPVCRGVFAESFDKLGVCVRLREMVELLFPEKAAARRADLEKQLAAERKRSASRVQEEDVPQLVMFPSSQATRPGRRRLHARRHNTQQAAAASTGSAGTAGRSQGLPLTAAVGGVSTPALPLAVGSFGSAVTATPAVLGSAAPLTDPSLTAVGPSAAASHLILNLSANPSSSNTGNPFNYQLSAQQLHQVQVAMAAAAADQLQQFDSVMQEPQTVTWPILDVQFTMGWYESHGRRSCRNNSRRCRRRAARA